MPAHPDAPLRVALLSYRGTPHSGGLGVYVRNLSRSLVALGHDVTVFGGQPFPELDEGVGLVKLPSLDLYRAEDPFRVPKLREFRSRIDVLEFGVMAVTTVFPEPLTFSLRARRALRERAGRFDVVHDNAGLGLGLLSIQKDVPVVATIHHAPEIDKKVILESEPSLKRRFAYRRWYGFIYMQQYVARRIPRVLTVSSVSRDDIVRESRVDASKMRVVPNGVDADTFRPRGLPRVPGRIITTASMDVPIKGLPVLLEALAKVRTERDVHLVVVGKPKPDSPTLPLIERFGLEGAVQFVNGLDESQLADAYATAELAVVPSIYEGFSLPAVEAMACGTPVVATTGGAIPEVVGEAGVLVAPGDPGALAAAIRNTMDDQPLRDRLGRAGRERVLERFTWARAAEQTADVYRELL